MVPVDGCDLQNDDFVGSFLHSSVVAEMHSFVVKGIAAVVEGVASYGVIALRLCVRSSEVSP